jgi:hypothetical protein
LPGYNFSSQAIDVPLETKISHGVLNNSGTGEDSLHTQHWLKYGTLGCENQASSI